MSCRAAAVGALTVLKFFGLPPATLRVRGAAASRSDKPDDELLLAVFRLPNHGARWTLFSKANR
jgi:hypothetical protein